MSKKRNPKSKRVHDSDSGKFLSEETVNSRTPFGYNDDGGSGSLLAGVIKLGIVLFALFALGMFLI
jgi:hypothetical protein